MRTDLALEPQVTRAAVEALAQRAGWRHVETFEAAATHGYEMQWHAPRYGVEIAYVENGIVGQAWLSVSGTEVGVGHEVAAIRATLPCHSLGEVLQRLRQAGGASAHGMLAGMLAVLASEAYDNDVMHALADLLLSAVPQVRMQALLAAANIGWPLLRPLVAAVADTDDEPAVRQRAAQVLVAFDAAAPHRHMP